MTATRPRHTAVGLSLAGVLGCSGCGVQLGAGAHLRGPRTLPYALSATTVLHSPAGSGVFASARTTLADPDAVSRYGFRHLIGGGGYRLVSRYGGGELAVEAGGGEPAFVSYHGPGLYAGGSVAGLVRLLGEQDVEPGFAPASVLLDLVHTARAGVWSPPLGDAQQQELGVASLHLGLRLTLLSDLADATGRGIAP